MSVFRSLFSPPCSLPALLMGLGLVFIGCSPESQLGEEAARERLKKRLREVHRADNSRGLLDLYYLEGVEDRDLRLIQLAIENEIHLPIRRMTFRELEPGDGIDYVFEGKQYGPTLKPELKLEVQYDTEDRLTVAYLVGFQDGEYHIVTARPTGPADVP